MLKGEYGVNGLFVGVPAIIGKNGVEKILELQLLNNEKIAFNNSVSSVQKVVDELNQLL